MLPSFRRLLVCTLSYTQPKDDQAQATKDKEEEQPTFTRKDEINSILFPFLSLDQGRRPPSSNGGGGEDDEE